MSAIAPQIAVIVGSLRPDSLNRRLAAALERLAGPRARFQDVPIGDLPLYNPDAPEPASAQRLRDQIKACDAVLFVSPEYNRSLPGVLKNAIDIGSRPNAFAGKLGAVIGTSRGARSTALMQQHLRNIGVFLDIAMMAQLEGFVRYTDGLIADDGTVTDAATRDFLARFVDAYLDWIARFVR